MSRASLLLLALSTAACRPSTAAPSPASAASSEQPKKAAVEVAPGVWFQEYTYDFGSNVAWVEMADHVVVFDTAFPKGAEAALASIRRTTKGKPVRYAVVSHYHHDHAFGSGVFAAQGTIVVGHRNARRDHQDRNVGLWERWAKDDKQDPRYRRFRAHAPELTFSDRLELADRNGRTVELLHLGHGHTSGDVFAWLPKERVLMTGDACDNGPYNYVPDADTASWIGVLARAEALAPKIVLPGHGLVGGAELLVAQRRYLEDVRAAVAAGLEAGKTLADVKATVDLPAWTRWGVGKSPFMLTHVEHVYGELSRGRTSFHGVLGEGTPAIVAVPMEKGAPRPKLKLLVSRATPADRASIAAVAPNVELVVAADKQAALALAPQVDAARGEFCNAEFLRAARALRWVQLMSAGADGCAFLPEVAGNERVVLTSMKGGVFGPNVADHAIGLLLAVTRGIGSRAPRTDLAGRTALVVGVGGIGRQIARRAEALGMRVVGVDPREGPVPDGIVAMHRPEALDALLPDADVVLLAAPLTPGTRGLFGRARLARLKPGAYFVNIARGAEVDTAALVAALEEKRLAGAGLDVTDPEPLPADHPLRRMPNVVVTDHVAGQSLAVEPRRRAQFLENVRRFAAGEPLLGVIDKRTGF